MSNLNILAAFNKRLALLSPALATRLENEPFTPVTGTPYQWVKLLPARPENPTLGDQYHREVGFLQITLMYPIAVAPGAAMARADLIKNHFKRGTSMTQSGQVIKVNRTPVVAAGIESGDRWAVPVSIEYYSEIFD